ncbi:MAG: LacI family DNA-binding transcriptional regulator [Phycisphaerales bacterium]|nr:LacI family DNA-binding transcriptional regulator [Phycisphaerales bacterium]
MPASIADVAKRANVSISTVSRVLNRRELVNEKTRTRVESAIAELGYAPNAFARGLMLRRSEIVGLVLPDLHGEFYSEIIRGANAQARQMGYNLVVSSAHDGSDSQSLLSAIHQRTLLDGVCVMVSEVTDRIQETLAEFRLPFVVLDGDINGTPHDSVVIDQRFGAESLMRHLVGDCGAKRIIFVGGLKTNVDTMARFEAYRHVLAERGLIYSPRDVFHLDYQYDTAHELASRSARSWAGPATAVFAANDEMAAGIVTAAAAAGLRVPQDLAVVGFDDTRIARMTRPQLTTVRVPMAEMGARAIELLCLRIAEPQRPTTRVQLRPELVVRESCGCGGSGA